MAPARTPPGNMTVPPTFGWEDIASVLALLSVVALVFLALVVAVASFAGHSDWQGYLGARSHRLAEDAESPADEVSSLG